MVVKFLAAILRVYSFVFHMTLSVFLLGLAGIAYHGSQPLSLGMLSFAEEGALRDTAIFGVLGIICSLLALTRGFKFVFMIWTLLVVYLMIRIFFLGPYALQLPAEIRSAAWLTLGAVGAFFGSAWAMKTQRRSGFF